MADIELVIKIPEGLKKDFELEQWTALSCMEMKDALEKATLLPKGHGRLIDASALGDALLYNWHVNNKYLVPYNDRRGYRLRDDEVKTCITNAPTIIEADKEDK